MTKHTPEQDRIIHERAIILFAIEHGENNAQALMAATGLARKELSNRMEKMKNEGLITMISYGKWQVVGKEPAQTVPDWPVLALKWAGYPVDCRV